MEEFSYQTLTQIFIQSLTAAQVPQCGSKRGLSSWERKTNKKTSLSSAGGNVSWDDKTKHILCTFHIVTFKVIFQHIFIIQMSSESPRFTSSKTNHCNNFTGWYITAQVSGSLDNGWKNKRSKFLSLVTILNPLLFLVYIWKIFHSYVRKFRF